MPANKAAGTSAGMKPKVAEVRNAERITAQRAAQIRTSRATPTAG